jgi:hypothetical protein
LSPQFALEQHGPHRPGLHWWSGGIPRQRRRLLETLRVLDSQRFERGFLARQPEEVEKHQPQALTGARPVGAGRILQQRANRDILAIRIQHGRLFGFGVDRIDFGFDLKLVAVSLNTNSLRSSGGASVAVTGVANGISARARPTGRVRWLRLVIGDAPGETPRSSFGRGTAAGRATIFFSGGGFLKNEKTIGQPGQRMIRDKLTL